MLPTPESSSQLHQQATRNLFLANRKIADLENKLKNMQKELDAAKAQNCELTKQLTREKVPGEKLSLVVSKPTRETVLFRSFSNLKVLSNFYAAPLTYDGQTFPTAEHAYQYRKAVFHKQWGTASLIKSASSPRDAKFIAKRIIQIPTWHECKPEFMSDILMAKSRQCPEFSKALIGTGEKHLLHNIETDSYWGCGGPPGHKYAWCAPGGSETNPEVSTPSTMPFQQCAKLYATCSQTVRQTKSCTTAKGNP
jgi:ribA/ribD-fused uncharacterized protein